LNANPCIVTQREIRMPRAASLLTFDPDSNIGIVSRRGGSAIRPNSAAVLNQYLLQITDVAPDVAAIRRELDDRVANAAGPDRDR
jgi:hypothetical protein